MFKVGDRVRRINGSFKWLKEGMILPVSTVRDVKRDGWRNYDQVLGFDVNEVITDGFTSDQFEIVHPKLPFVKEDWM